MKRTWSLNLISLWVLLVLAACQGPDTGAPVLADQDGVGVFGGERVRAGNPLFPYMVGVVRERTDGSVVSCSGTLLSRRWVLTAAHCVPDDSEILRLTFLSPDLNDESLQDGWVDESFVPPEYASVHEKGLPNAYDIALMHLKADAPAGAKVMPAASSGFNEQNLTSAQIAGYGSESYNAVTHVFTGPLTLKVATVKLQESTFAGVLQFNQTAGTGGCVGDSGGPAFITTPSGYLQVGVMGSINNPGGRDACRGFSNFASLGFSANWITFTMTKLAP